jgi:hypothetical protein
MSVQRNVNGSISTKNEIKNIKIKAIKNPQLYVGFITNLYIHING